MGNAFFFVGAKVLSFSSVFLLVMGIKFYLANKNKTSGYPEGVPFIYKGFYHEIKLFKENAGSFLLRTFPRKSEAIRRDLRLAALSLDVSDVYGAQTFWGCACGLLAGVLMLVLSMPVEYLLAALLMGAFIGWLIPLVKVQNLANARQSSMQRDLPFSIDLITSAMAAGLDFTAAVRYYVEQINLCALSHEYRITLRYLELGHARTDALKAMAERLQLPEFNSLVNAVIQGTEMGASIVDTLRINAEEMRRVRMATAERKAQRAPSLMMIPMALFIMPAVFIVIFVPIYLRVKLSGMGGMF